MSTSLLGSKVIKLDAIDSTNDYVREMLLNNVNISDGTVVLADFQAKGKGQRTKKWMSEPGLNLTMSVVLYPVNLKVSDQFLLTKIASLGVVAYLSALFDAKMSGDIKIKWPNDIYVGDNKICGILIENMIRSDLIASTIIGIGLNVNQDVFPEIIVNPTSIKLELNRQFDLNSVRIDLCSYIETQYLKLTGVNQRQLNEEYEALLYGRDLMKKYRINHKIIEAKLMGVSNIGELLLEGIDGSSIVCNHEEIVYL